MPGCSQRTWDQVLGSALLGGGALAITTGHILRKAPLTGRMRREKRATDITKQCWGCRKSHYRREASILGTGKPSVLGIGFRGETASLENVWQGAWSNGHLEYETGMPKYP